MAMASRIVGRTIKVKSIDRLQSSDTQNDFTVDLSGTTNEVDSDVILRSIAIPNTTYNVNNYTNLIQFTITGGTSAGVQDTSIPVNNYTGSQLAAQLTTTITGFTVTYDFQSAKFTFTPPGDATSWSIDFGTRSHMSRLLGFPPNVDFTEASATAKSSTLIAQLHGFLMFSIHMDGYTAGQTTSKPNQNDNTLFTIQGDKKFGDLIHFDPMDSMEAYKVHRLFNKHRFYLTTDYGNGLGEQPLDNQSEFEFLLTVFSHRDLKRLMSASNKKFIEEENPSKRIRLNG